MHVRTIGPVMTPLWLRQGHDPRSAAYGDVLAALPPENNQLTVPNRAEGMRSANFSRSRADDLDLRLFVWTAPAAEGQTGVRIHVYPTGASVLETFQAAPPLFPVEECERAIQDEAARAFERVAPAFAQMLRRVERRLPKDFAEPIPANYEPSTEDMQWSARTLVVSEAERADPGVQRFIRSWLEPTARPEEAGAIIAGEIDLSMTWLNYIVVERDKDFIESQFSAIRTAQYFYAAQSILNLEAQDRLVAVVTKRGVRKLERQLIQYRRRMQILRILFETQKGFLSRDRRRKFDDMMTLWDFDDLMENGNRIIAASSDRIGEIISRRSERSSSFTDAILFGIALFAIIEVALYLTEYSREMMSRPALSYEDEALPFTMRFLATIDADLMLLSGVFLTVLLIGLYALWKRRG
jgi:hypothetical protein